MMARRDRPAPPTPPEGVEIMRMTKRDAWLAARGRDVTASVVGALFGVHEYCSRYELYARKAGLLAPEGGDGETSAMRRGRLFETVAVEMIREDHPDWTIVHNAADNVYHRDPVARLGATPDVIAHDPARGWGVVQIKTTGRVTFDKKWRDEDGEIEPPLWIMLQAELERHLTGGSWAAVAPLVVDEFFDARLELFDVPETPGLIDTMKAKAAEFWRDVEEGREPAPDYEADARVIERAHPEADPENEIDATDSDRVKELLRERGNAQRVRRFATKEIERIDTEIKHLMGDASVMHLGEGRKIEWRNQRRSGRWIAPSNGRVLRLPKSTEDNE